MVMPVLQLQCDEWESTASSPYLEEVLGDEVQPLRVVADALQAGVLVQHRVVRVQEEVQRVLVQEVDLDTGNIMVDEFRK